MAQKKTYKQLKDELQTVIDKLQDAETDIDEALKLYKSAATLIDELELYLKKSKHELEHLKLSD